MRLSWEVSSPGPEYDEGGGQKVDELLANGQDLASRVSGIGVGLVAVEHEGCKDSRERWRGDVEVEEFASCWRNSRSPSLGGSLAGCNHVSIYGSFHGLLRWC